MEKKIIYLGLDFMLRCRVPKVFEARSWALAKKVCFVLFYFIE